MKAVLDAAAPELHPAPLTEPQAAAAECQLQNVPRTWDASSPAAAAHLAGIVPAVCPTPKENQNAAF